MKTTVIVQVVSSERDRNGNRYHFAVFHNPAKGRQYSVAMEVGGESNARHIAYTLAGDWESTLCFDKTLPKREWQRARKFAQADLLYEGGAEAKAALSRLFSETV